MLQRMTVSQVNGQDLGSGSSKSPLGSDGATGAAGAAGTAGSDALDHWDEEEGDVHNYYLDDECEDTYGQGADDGTAGGYGGSIPHELLLTSPSVHVLAEIMLAIISGIMATKGFASRS